MKRLANAVLRIVWRIGARRRAGFVLLVALIAAGWMLAPTEPSTIVRDERPAGEGVAAGDTGSAAFDCGTAAEYALEYAVAMEDVDFDEALDAYFKAFALHPANPSLDRALALMRREGLRHWIGDGDDAGQAPMWHIEKAARHIAEDKMRAAEAALRNSVPSLAQRGEIGAMATVYGWLAEQHKPLPLASGDPFDHRFDGYLWRSLLLQKWAGADTAFARGLHDLAEAMIMVNERRSDVFYQRFLVELGDPPPMAWACSRDERMIWRRARANRDGEFEHMAPDDPPDPVSARIAAMLSAAVEERLARLAASGVRYTIVIPNRNAPSGTP